LSFSQAIRDFLIDRQIRNATQETLSWYRIRLHAVMDHIGDRDLQQITMPDVRSLIAALMARGLKASTVNGHLTPIKALLNWASEEGLAVGIDPKSIRLLRQPKHMPEVLTPEHLARLIETADGNTFYAKRDRMMIITLADTGIRVGELCNLGVTDADLPLLRVFGKSRKGRVVAMSLFGQREMTRYLRIRNQVYEDEGALFPSRYGCGHLDRDTVGNIVKEIARRAGITDVRVTCHAFRRTFASTWCRRSGNLFHLQKILGHESLEMVRRYAAVFDQDAFEEAMTLSPLAETEQPTRRRSKRRGQATRGHSNNTW